MTASVPSRADAAIDRLGLGLTLLVPVFLTHGRAVADIALSIVAILFLLRSASCAHGFAWLAAPWVRIAALWWLWLVLCSARVLGTHGAAAGLVQAIVMVRFLVFAAALETWVLAAGRARPAMATMLAIPTAYIALQCLWQFATGHNWYGRPRFPDGSLTGPYAHPRAAAPLSRLLFPVLLPLAIALLPTDRPARTRLRAAAGIGLALGVALAALSLMVLCGQRMPLLLCGLGLLVVAAMLPRLRVALLLLLASIPVLVALASVVSPPSFHHLWTVFSAQIGHFPQSPYGLIAVRALRMIEASPWFGLGFDGYRDDCADPRFFHGWHGGDGGGAWAGVCVQHPHNHYLQAAVQAGLPGLVLFGATVLAWLAAAARGLWRASRPDPLRVGLLAALVMQEWPIASASAFAVLPLGGWFFLLLGFALGLARPTSHPARGR